MPPVRSKEDPLGIVSSQQTVNARLGRLPSVKIQLCSRLTGRFTLETGHWDRIGLTADFRAAQKAEILLSYKAQHGVVLRKTIKRK